MDNILTSIGIFVSENQWVFPVSWLFIMSMFFAMTKHNFFPIKLKGCVHYFILSRGQTMKIPEDSTQARIKAWSSRKFSVFVNSEEVEAEEYAKHLHLCGKKMDTGKALSMKTGTTNLGISVEVETPQESLAFIYPSMSQKISASIGLLLIGGVFGLLILMAYYLE